MEKFTIKIDKRGACVYSGDTPIASISRFNNLFVEPLYRGQGIAENMIAAWWRANMDYVPQHKPVRSVQGDHAYKRAWAILEKEIETPEKS